MADARGAPGARVECGRESRLPLEDTLLDDPVAIRTSLSDRRIAWPRIFVIVHLGHGVVIVECGRRGVVARASREGGGAHGLALR